MTFKLNFHRIIIEAFFVVAILYYFLRFQFNLDSEILFVYGSLQIVIVLFSTILILTKNKFTHSKVSKIVFVFLVHSIFLSLLTSFKTLSVDAFLYSFKDYLFPVILFWCASLFKIDLLKQLKSLGLISFVVAIIYLTDFYLKIILKQDALIYLSGIRNLTMDVTNSDSLSGTFIKGDLFDFIRFEGPLGHNSPTSILIALGVFISYNLYQHHKSGFQFGILFVNSIALILSANRTAIIALIFIVATLRLLDGKIKMKKNSVLFRFLGIVSVLSFFGYFVENPLFSVDSLFSGLSSILFNNEEIAIFAGNLWNPFSYIGTGFPCPYISKVDYIISFRSDDFFVLQLLNTYGIFSFFLFIALIQTLIKTFKKKVNKDDFLYRVYFGIVFMLFFSTLHAGSLVRPQIYPILFFSLGALHAISVINLNVKGENSNITK